MDNYKIYTPEELIKGNTYSGRGIIVGKSADGKKAAAAYFIMGRSANSRNRVFTKKDGDIYTEPFDPSKVEDPSLIIYRAVAKLDNRLIVTNGDQTDTIYNAIKDGSCFTRALRTRCFEPDGPNFTPRISAMITFAYNDFTYKMSILKSIDEKGSNCARYTFDYPSVSGLGHFIHTYIHDGDPLPTFMGEPERIRIPDDIDSFTNELWEVLDPDNRISLYVRYIDLETGAEEDRLINKNK